MVLSSILVLFLEMAVNSHFKFTLHASLINLCLSRDSGICQVSVDKLEWTSEEVIIGLEPRGVRGEEACLMEEPRCPPSLQRAGRATASACTNGHRRTRGVEPCPVRALAKTEGCDKAQGLEWGNRIFESWFQKRAYLAL